MTDASNQDYENKLSEMSNIVSSFMSLLDRYNELAAELDQSQVKRETAITRFMDNLNQFLEGRETFEVHGAQGNGYTLNEKGYTKDEIVALINSMRNQGSTFIEIAESLRKNGIPTFSGRGDWHAQTIHRLCR